MHSAHSCIFYKAYTAALAQRRRRRRRRNAGVAQARSASRRPRAPAAGRRRQAMGRVKEAVGHERNSYYRRRQTSPPNARQFGPGRPAGPSASAARKREVLTTALECVPWPTTAPCVRRAQIRMMLRKLRRCAARLHRVFSMLGQSSSDVTHVARNADEFTLYQLLTELGWTLFVQHQIAVVGEIDSNKTLPCHRKP